MLKLFRPAIRGCFGTVAANPSVETSPHSCAANRRPVRWRELAAVFSFGHADSVRNLTRRIDRALPDSGKLRYDIGTIRQGFLKAEGI